MMFNKIISILLAVFIILLAGFFAGSETGLYRLSRLRLRLGLEKKQLRYILLGKCVHDGPGLLLSMLIGTNLAHYLTTSIVTLLLYDKFSDHTAEVVATSITAPLLFVFAELIPKNVFFYSADFLMPLLAPFLYIIHKFFIYCGAVPLLKSFSGLVARIVGSSSYQKSAITSSPRRKVQAILEDTHEEGILSSIQTDIVNRLVKISHVSVRAIMIPTERLCSVTSDADFDTVFKCLKKHPFSRLPVLDTKTGIYQGYINIYDVINAGRENYSLNNYLKPVRTIDAGTNVVDAINFMQNERQKILLVTTQSHTDHPRYIGLVTMKDLVEELLGDIAEW